MACRRAILTWLAAGALAWGAAPPPAPAQEPLPSPLIETATSELVLIEVYARDRKGKPVRDLRIDELTLKVDQHTRPKTIVALEWVEPPPGAAPLPGGPPPGPAAAAPEADAAPGLAGRRDWPRRFMLFFDDATSSAIQMTNARRQAIAFLDRPGLPSDQFALASYSEKRRLEVLHDFTSDRAALRAILERGVEDTVRRSDYAGERITRSEEIRRLRLEAGQWAYGAPIDDQADQLARSYAAQDSALMGRVLTSMRMLVDAISPWPGYKAVVFIGEGVPENPANDYGLNDARQALTSEIGHLAMAAGGSNVTLHSVQVDGIAAGGPGDLGASSRRTNSLATLALDTGGVHVTSNDLLGALADVERGAEGYYLLAYAPEGPPDGLHHSVNIKVKRGGVYLRYRRNFTRFRPEEARMRAIQAAHLTPELHGEMGVDLAAVAGPAAGDERLFDLVLYLPPQRILFMPQPGGLAARVEVGIVAIDGSGRETLRLARRVRLSPGTARASAGGPLAIDFFSRVRLPDRSQTITAVVADVQSGEIGAARRAIGETGGSATGLSLYALDERSLWVEVDAGPEGRSTGEQSADSTVGPALRTRFAPGERVSCGFRTPPAPPGGAPALRLVVLRGDEVVRRQPVEADREAERVDGTMHDEPLPTAGLADGEYAVAIEEMRPGGPVEIGRATFVIGTPPRR